MDYAQYVPAEGQKATELPALAVNSQALYYLVSWANSGSALAPGYSRQGAVMRVSSDADKPVLIASVPGGGGRNAQTFALTTSYVVFGAGDANVAQKEGAIYAVGLLGGNAKRLTATVGAPRAVVADDQHAYFVDSEGVKIVSLTGGDARLIVGPGSDGFSLGVVGPTLYFADATTSSISAVSTSGGSPKVLANGSPGAAYPSNPIACADSVCWLSSVGMADYAIMRMSPDGMLMQVAAGFSEPLDLVFDGNDFFVSGGAGGLYLSRVAASGNDSGLVASDPGMASIAVGKDCIYWSSFSGISAMSRNAADNVSAGQ